MSAQALLVVPLVVAMGCATVDGPRRLVSARPLGTRCEPGRPTAVLDPGSSDRVRLVFGDTEHCSEGTEATYAREQGRRLSDTARGVVAAGAGLIVAVPLMGLLFTAVTKPQPFPGLDVHQSYTPTFPAAGDPLLKGILLLGLGVALGAHQQLGVTERVGTIEVAEQTSTATIRQRVVTSGTVNAAGFPVGGLQLIAGVLELSLDEAQGLAEGELFLDGARVELAGDTGERLGFLPICKRALDRFDGGLPSWDRARREQAWRLAETCDRHGWTFAEHVRATGIAAAE